MVVDSKFNLSLHQVKTQSFNINQKKPNKMSKLTLTNGELEVLNTIKEYQNEEGHSDFLSDEIPTFENIKKSSVAGIISSLEKKEMIFDSYATMPENFKMWVTTKQAVQFVGVPSGWKHSGCWEHHVKHGGIDYNAIFLAK